MSISSATQGGPAIQNQFHQRRTDLKSMESAVQSGNLTAAQTALAAYQSDVQNLQAQLPSAGSVSSTTRTTRPLSDLSALTSSVQSGSLTSAQSTRQAYQQDRAGLQPANASSTSGTTQTGVGQDRLKLIQDSLSGNATAMQYDAANLTKDLQDAAPSGQATASTGQVSGTAGHHHHHHHHGAPQVAAGNGTDQTNTDSTPALGSATTQDSLISSLIGQLQDSLSLFDASPSTSTMG